MCRSRLCGLAVLMAACWLGTISHASDIHANDQQVEKTLNQMSRAEFIETPLEDVIEKFSEFHKIGIQIDQVALASVGVDCRTPVTLAADGIPFKTMLRLVLKPLGLTWIVRDGILLITTHEAQKNAAVQRIEEALQQTSSAYFVETPLEEAVAYFADLHDMRIHIDRTALVIGGIDERLPVTLSADGLQLESLLGLILEPHGLTWTVRHESLIITTFEAARRAVSTRVYQVDKLVPVQTGGVYSTGEMEGYGNMGSDRIPPHLTPGQALLHMITTTIEPQSWVQAGPGQAALLTIGDSTVLVVRQDYRTHRLIGRLLEDLARIGGTEKQAVTKAKSSSKPATRRPVPATPNGRSMGVKPSASRRGTGTFAPASDPFGSSGAAPADNPFGPMPTDDPNTDAPIGDPFGGAPANDPFGAPPVKDPFGGAPAEDPFGARPVKDPFGGKPANDPFS